MSNQDRNPDREQIVANLLSWKQWLRILLMIAGGIVSWLVTFIQILVAVLQAIFALVTGDDNERLRKAGLVLAMYQAQIWLYLSYASDTRPFPLNDLPADPDDLDMDRDEPEDDEPEDNSGVQEPEYSPAAEVYPGQDGEPMEEPFAEPEEDGDDLPWSENDRSLMDSDEDMDEEIGDDDFADDDKPAPRS